MSAITDTSVAPWTVMGWDPEIVVWYPCAGNTHIAYDTPFPLRDKCAAVIDQGSVPVFDTEFAVSLVNRAWNSILLGHLVAEVAKWTDPAWDSVSVLNEFGDVVMVAPILRAVE